MSSEKINRPRVTVLMNCFNGEEFLTQSIESVLCQTYSNWEIVFWDNQSTDRSAEIVKSFDDSRIRYFLADRHTHLGAGRRAAQTHFTGDWIAVLDTDDIWYPNKLEKQLNLITQTDPEGKQLGLVYSLAELLIMKDDGWSKSGLVAQTPLPPPSGSVFNQLARNNFIPQLTTLMNRRWFDEVGGFIGKYKIAEDYSINLRLAHCSQIAVVPEPLAAYRVHDLAVTKTSKAWLSDLEDIKVKIKYWHRYACFKGAMISTWRLLNKLL